MASSNKTEHFDLNQWVGSDFVLREDFNSDNEKIEAALLSITPVEGTYTGNDNPGANQVPSDTYQEIDLGFHPRAVAVIASGGPSLAYSGGVMNYGYATREQNYYDLGTLYYAPYLKVCETGFQVKGMLNLGPAAEGKYVNANPYRYFAWR